MALIGSRTFVEVRTPGGLEIMTMSGTLVAGDDLGDFERSEGVAGPEHDRLLFTMREHPFPEGLYLDRRTFESAEWCGDAADRELRIQLSDGAVVAVIEEAATD